MLCLTLSVSKSIFKCIPARQWTEICNTRCSILSRLSHFHVSHFPPLQHGAAFSCPAISCLAFSASPCRPMLWSCVGLSVFACVCPSQAAIVAHIIDDLRLYWNPKHPPQGNIYAVASPQGGLGWTYPPHFLLEVAPEIDTNPTSFYSGRGGGGRSASRPPL